MLWIGISSLHIVGFDRMTGRLSSPDISKALGYYSIPSITTWNNSAYVNLWNALNAGLPVYGMCIVPFSVYKIGDPYQKLITPGLGTHAFPGHDHALFQLLTHAFEGDTSDMSSALHNAITGIRQTTQSGYELMSVIGKHVVTALDNTKLLECPVCDGDLFRLANEVIIYCSLAEKRGTRFTPRNKAILFLDLCSTVVNTTVMLMTVKALPDSAISGNEWHVTTIARQLTWAEPTQSHGSSRVMKTLGTPVHHPLPPSSSIHHPLPPNSLSNSTVDSFIQGHLAVVNKLASTGKKFIRGQKERVPLHKPLPAPFEGRRLDRKANEGKRCDACLRMNHNANVCLILGQASYIWKFLKNGGNEDVIAEAEKHWVEHWKRKNPRGRNAQVRLIELMDVYSQATGISHDDICDQMDWDSFYPSDDQDYIIDDTFESADF